RLYLVRMVRTFAGLRGILPVRTLTGVYRWLPVAPPLAPHGSWFQQGERLVATTIGQPDTAPLRGGDRQSGAWPDGDDAHDDQLTISAAVEMFFGDLRLAP